MAITVRANPTTLTWANFTGVANLAGNEDAHINIDFDIPSVPPRQVGSNWMLAETFEIVVRPVAKVKNSATQTADLLSHEQGHYNIGIAVGWAMASDLQSLSAPTRAALGQQLTTAFNLHRTTRMGAVQQQYDQDTNHSQNTPHQSRWDTAIRNELTNRSGTLCGLSL
jgi:hypothetical protein